MSNIDWIVLGVTMFSIIAYGIWKTRGSQDMEGYFLGDNEAKWWTVGLSVMATQASAITFLSTPGQAFNDGMEFVQFYFTLPIAMIIICVTFIPLYYKMKVYTAYEFLENRFDVKSRTLTSFIFLLQRGLAVGITIYAPSIILSSVLGWDLNTTVIFIGIIAILYTVSGGTKAVHVTHKHQMLVILLGLFIIFFILINSMPEAYSLTESLSLASATGKLNVIETDFSWDDRYNIWTCLIAAPFLFLSYFGTDQSQVQRYISGKSIKESRLGLLFNGMFKVPLQFFILFLGILVFSFYQFTKSPIHFNQANLTKVEQSNKADVLARIQSDFDKVYDEKQALQSAFIAAKSAGVTQAIEDSRMALVSKFEEEKKIRSEVKSLIKSVDSESETNDKDYIFVSFILNHLPVGLVGLLFAMIFFAAMSSTASELNALAATTSVDIYQRLIKTGASDSHYLLASKLWTLFWGIVAVLFALFGTLFENLIQFVNIVGSIFYGSILGVFLVAFYFKKIKGNAVFFSALITQVIVIVIYFYCVHSYDDDFTMTWKLKERLSFLWLNPIGVILVIAFGYMLEPLIGNKRKNPA